tara:strand:- start:192 stop:485 length:294 start_codon:yes stop_codon:yes gene_type:complete
MYDYGELKLSKKELRQLGKFSCECLEDWRKSTDESLWYGVQFDKRMFDLNLWDDEEGNIVCTAYECDPMLEEFPDGSVEPNWTTNINFEKFLWSVKQ